MATIDTISIVSGIIILGYITMAQAYWEEIKQLEERKKQLQKEKTNNENQHLERDFTKINLLFKISTFMTGLTIILTITPLYLDQQNIGIMCKWLLLIPFLSMSIILFQFIAWKSKYFKYPRIKL